MELYRMTALELSSLIRKGEVSPSSLVEAVAKRIEEVEEKLSSYVTLTIDEALSEAKRVEERLTKGEELGPLAGIPIAVKDVICTKGIRTTCSSRMLENFVPPYDATVVRKLGYIACSRRLEWRLSSSGISGGDDTCLRLRYRGLDKTTSCSLRDSWGKAHLWTGFPIRPRRFRLLARSDRTNDQDGCRFCPSSLRYRWL